jgi:hypothetical protein
MTTLSTPPATGAHAELHEVHLELPCAPSFRDALRMPFAPGRHPDTDRVGLENLRWLAAHGLLHAHNVRVFERGRFHELAGRVHHRSDRDTLRLLADFIGALFVLDDLMDTAADPACRNPERARASIERVRRAARTGHAPLAHRDAFDAVASGLSELTRRLERRGAPLHAYLRELDRYLDGLVEESRRRAIGFRSVADYAELRQAFSAVYACIELGLAAAGATLPPALGPLARAVNLSVSYVNDVLSWPKERALGERSNLVRVIMDQHGLDERTALHVTCRHSDAVVDDYLDACDPRALELLESWMRGNLDWHLVGTARYAEHLSVAVQAAPAPAREPITLGA